jgi:hypothetical protein
MHRTRLFQQSGSVDPIHLPYFVGTAKPVSAAIGPTKFLGTDVGGKNDD